jgi:DNA-binding MarR family transcriptional regulator
VIDRAPLDRNLTNCQAPDITATHRTEQGEAATRLILTSFRANGLLLAAGDELAAEEGLSAARWQVLGALALAERPLTVPQIARRMGLTRQSVHATVNRLLGDGLLERHANADHRRSPLVALTAAGRATYDALDRRQAVWVNRLAAGVDPRDLETAARVLDQLCDAVEGGER